ncbi:hypothetical protein [Endozoicomonas sp. SCSIO W0465]|uniref:hypothetical protein n=1 Tax=Endozoicomonas sp. SCSIO W0465 TaxID=2918516 RepID=UPI002075947A|nr:hypothetical protein [Endozoicomonas sp. SCSIO W0465]USE35617.1 hypothetical protein MJO57_26605 [Endozoicomonas sp. SCSIO W0465]
MPEIFVNKRMPCFRYGHFFYALKPVSLRTAAYTGRYNARLFSGYRLLCNENWPKALIYNAFRKLLAKYCQALPQEDSSLIYEISSLQYEKSLMRYSFVVGG